MRRALASSLCAPAAPCLAAAPAGAASVRSAADRVAGVSKAFSGELVAFGGWARASGAPDRAIPRRRRAQTAAVCAAPAR